MFVVCAGAGFVVEWRLARLKTPGQWHNRHLFDSARARALTPSALFPYLLLATQPKPSPVLLG